MQFTRLSGGSHDHGKAAKFALVAGLHVALGALFIHSINTKKISLSSLPDPIQVMLTPDRQVPPPPPPEPKPAAGAKPAISPTRR